MAMTSEGVGVGRDPQGVALLQCLASHFPATFKTDHRRAIDRYIDYFGDCAATGPEPCARQVTSVDEQAIPDGGAEGPRRHIPL